MSLDIFFLDDIRNALLAADAASSGVTGVAFEAQAQLLDQVYAELAKELQSAKGQRLLAGLHLAAKDSLRGMVYYRRGYRAALVTIALAFGVSPAVFTTRPVFGGLLERGGD